jgi:hypothetical protein
MSRIGTELDLMTTRIKRGIRNGKYTLSEVQTKLSEGTRRAARKTDYFVHDNAWGAMGVAAGLAFIGGFFLARKTTETEIVVGSDGEQTRVEQRPPFTIGELIHGVLPLAVLAIKAAQVARGRKVKV